MCILKFRADPYLKSFFIKKYREKVCIDKKKEYNISKISSWGGVYL